MNIIESHLEKILTSYTKESYYEEMKKALAIYSDKTGSMDEDTDEYEGRMNSFNDWFIFNYRKEDNSRIIDHYIADFSLDESLAKSFHNINYSLFYFAKRNFKKQIVLKDILHNEKFVLSKENGNLAMVEDDLFIGRLVEIDGQIYLMKGVCHLPYNVLSILKKQSKKVRKLNNDVEEENYLLKLEGLKTKSLQYGHVDTSQIFDFK